jgi:hypothetical protein
MAVVIASTLPILTSSNAMRMKRRQIAEPRKFSSVSAARCAISVSPQRMDFYRAADDPWIWR